MRSLASAIVVTALLGCSSAQVAERNLESIEEYRGPQSVAYKAGFSDGCGSGLKETRGWTGQDEFKRDEKRMERDAEYRSGWTDGARNCRVR